MKYIFQISFLFIAALSSRAAVNIQFYEPFFGGIASNLANSAGVVTDGMRWGIVVDTSSNGFASGGTSYTAYASGVTTAGFLSASGSTTDDYFIPGAITKNASGNYPGGDFDGTVYTTPGSGSIIDDLVTPDFVNVAGLGANDKFALVWFSTSTSAVGDRYGFFEDVSFLLPTDGSLPTSYGTPFAGVDPIRSASNTFQAVPEPSRVLFLALGSMGFFMRRRRA